MTQRFESGDSVKWQWGEGWGEGTVKRVFKSDTTLTLKGTEVTRNATPDAPAYLIEQADGDEVLKGHSEVESAA